ncbi:unnamed protein product [Symbiodinium sp. CCMP2456]|nr:unnamed protein product [Symbiodinium sp. CCMP2456]
MEVDTFDLALQHKAGRWRSRIARQLRVVRKASRRSFSARRRSPCLSTGCCDLRAGACRWTWRIRHPFGRPPLRAPPPGLFDGERPSNAKVVVILPPLTPAFVKDDVLRMLVEQMGFAQAAAIESGSVALQSPGLVALLQQNPSPCRGTGN